MKLSVNKIKFLCLLFFVGLAIVIFAAEKPLGYHAAAFSSGPPAGVTGAPGEVTCTNCHVANTGAGQFSINAPQTYTPGQTYQIVVRHVTGDSSRRRWGFQLTALAGNSAAGTLAGGGTTQTLSANGRNYIQHTTTGSFPNQAGGAIWTFNWTAPAVNVGAVTMFAAGNQANNDGTADGDQIYATNVTIQPAVQNPTAHHVTADFDADGKTDISVFRPNVGTWYLNRSTAGFTGTQFGNATDKIAPADYDGDDKTDIAVWRENGTASANFYILNSSNGTFRAENFGATGDALAVADYDGDGKADPAVYRPGASAGQQSFFFYIGSQNGGFSAIAWGSNGDLPVRGDFDGDSKADAAVFRPADGIWFIRQSSNGNLQAVQWGISTDKRAAADYDGDSKTDIAVYRDGNWFIRQSSNGAFLAFNWGIATDELVPGDYDGDAKADVAVYRDGNWYIRQSSNGALNAQTFGTATDLAVPASYIR